MKFIEIISDFIAEKFNFSTGRHKKTAKKPRLSRRGAVTLAAAAITAVAVIPAMVSARGLFTGSAVGTKAIGALLVEEVKNPDDSITITSVISAENDGTTGNSPEEIIPAAPESQQTAPVNTVENTENTIQQTPAIYGIPGLYANSVTEFKIDNNTESAVPSQTLQTNDGTAPAIFEPNVNNSGIQTLQPNAPVAQQTSPIDTIVQPQPAQAQSGAVITETTVPAQDTPAQVPNAESSLLNPNVVNQPQIKELTPEGNSADVKELQQRLMDLGYMDNDEPTDYYGPATQQAVRYFQRKHGLVNDGFAGAETQSILFSDAAQPYSVTMGADGPDVERIQERLAELGYPVTASGYFGTDTDYAVRYFQRMNGLTDDGSVGHDTKEILYSDSAEPALELAAKPKKNADSSSTAKKNTDKPSQQSGETNVPSENTTYTANPGNVEAFISVAMAQVGKPYVLGGKGPNSFDCSGFVYYALKQSGNSISYMTSGGWANSSFPTIGSINDLQRGDIICMTGHVGIYLGNGKMVDASSSNGQIVVRDVGPWAQRNFKCGKRPL